VEEDKENKQKEGRGVSRLKQEARKALLALHA
jgi:hypothetical protein